MGSILKVGEKPIWENVAFALNRVSSVMIEINRSLYMDEKSGEKNIGFHKISNLINEFIEEINKRKQWIEREAACFRKR